MTDAERTRAERAIIGSVLMEPERCLAAAVNAGVDCDWFTDPKLALAWTAAKTLFRERSAVDELLLVERAGRIAADEHSPHHGVVFGLADIEPVIDATVTSAHFEYYLELCRFEVMFRRVNAASRKFGRAVSEGLDVATATQRLSQAITSLMAGAMGAKAVSVGDVCARIEAEYQAAHQKRIVEGDLAYTPGIKIPFEPMNIASQGVQEGLYYIGARPSVGKTAFVLNLIRAWCEDGVKVAFNSLDMAVKPMLKRPVGELSRVSFAKASFGTTTKADLNAIHEAIHGVRDSSGELVKKGVMQWPLTLIQERDVDVFRSWCLAMRQMGKLDIVIVDFVQLMGTKSRYSNDNEKLEYVSGVLKSIAIDLEIPVIALSQLNRACEDDGGRIPTASDLRGSGALEQDATAVWILHADRDVMKKWYTPNEQGRHPNMPVGLTVNVKEEEFKGIGAVRVIIAKNQNGQAGPDVWFPFVFFKRYCLFMLGDYEAKCPTVTVGYGVSAKSQVDYSPKYARVTHDYRNDPFEYVLNRNGCLVGGEAVQGEMDYNA